MYFSRKKISVGFIYDEIQIKKKYLNTAKWKKFFSVIFKNNSKTVMASTRLRVHDIIWGFKNYKNYKIEIFKPWKKYNIVIFQKIFNKESLKIAKKLKRKGTKIILDINVNYYDKSHLSKKYHYQYDEVINFTKQCDHIITTGEYLKKYINQKFKNKKISVIYENIPDQFFQIQKDKINKTDNIKFIYSGYACKAKEILLIKDYIKNLAQKYNIEYIFICEKNPQIKINGVKTNFVKYDQKIIYKQLNMGDIFLTPRDLNNKYNLGHSFTKIGSPMATGIPIIASPVPSYIGSPAIIINDFSNKWYEQIEKLIKDKKYYQLISKKGIEYCKKNYNIKKIISDYKKIFENI